MDKSNNKTRIKRVAIVLVAVGMILFTENLFFVIKNPIAIKNPLHKKTIELKIQATEEGFLSFQYANGMIFVPLENEYVHKLYTDVDEIGKWKFDVTVQEIDPYAKITIERPFIALIGIDEKNIRDYYHDIYQIEIACPFDKLKFVNLSLTPL